MLTQAPRLAFQEDRRKRVAEALLRGLNVRQIATELDINKNTACADVQAVRQEWREDRINNHDELVAEELQRLEALYAAHYPKAIAGSRDSAQVLLSISSKRCRILGLNAPTEVRLEATMSLTASPEFCALTACVLEALQDHPELRSQVAAKLAALEAPVLEGELVAPRLTAHAEHDDE